MAHTGLELRLRRGFGKKERGVLSLFHIFKLLVQSNQLTAGKLQLLSVNEGRHRLGISRICSGNALLQSKIKLHCLQLFAVSLRLLLPVGIVALQLLVGITQLPGQR